MLKRLFVKNFIIIEDAEIEFSSGLNIITGESGSGKSAILKAIDATLGSKLDPTCIFPNKELSIVEATFELQDLNELQQMLPDYELEKTIKLRREISSKGRSRSFINDQLINLTKLKDCSILFTDYISQKHTASLYQEKYITSFVDALGGCKNEVTTLSKFWSNFNLNCSKIEKLTNEKTELEETIPALKEDLEWINKVNYNDGEEKQLEDEHNRLLNSQERKELTTEICSQLTDLPDSALFKLRNIDKTFQKVLSVDSQVEDLYKIFKNALIELTELSYELSKLNGNIDNDFELLRNIESRIKDVDLLRKKFGGTFADIEQHKSRLLDKIDSFEEIEESLENLNKENQDLEKKIDQLCEAISSKRSQAGKYLNEKMHKELYSLNLPNSSFELKLEKKPRTSSGDESPLFLFSANLNSKAQQLQKVASGGELARVMLALKCIIADKGSQGCLIFDEIDSNVGGKSAAIIGDKLLKLSEHKQIICVTHFVQVAKKANLHFLIEKSQKNGFNSTIISKLEDSQKQLEYQRMVGSVLTA